MLEQARGRGRSASRSSATATSVEPRWSPAAGSSLQLTASRTRTPLSMTDAKNAYNGDNSIHVYALCSCTLRLQVLGRPGVASLHGNASDDHSEQQRSHKTDPTDPAPPAVRPVHLRLRHRPPGAQHPHLLQRFGSACVCPCSLTHIHHRGQLLCHRLGCPHGGR